MTLRQHSLRRWYEFSKGEAGRRSRSSFFALIDGCTTERFAKIVAADLQRPAPGELRSLASIRQYFRRNTPTLDELRGPAPDEQTLQWFFMLRGYLHFKHEAIIERELPVSSSKDDREGSVDLLAFDLDRRQPMLVELKPARASDSLTGVLLEVLSHWAFHMRYLPQFQQQVAQAEVVRSPVMQAPTVAIAAPESYFVETLRRSGDPGRHNEIRVAAQLIRCMLEIWGVQVRLLAIEDGWQQVGLDFAIRDWAIPAE
jgi:hypothetical protein